MLNKITQGDCLVESDNIPSGSVDLILTDLPYGNMKGMGAESIKTDNAEGYVAGGGYKKGYDWDTVIDPKRIHEIANRVLRKNGKLVLFAQQPFTTQLINEAIPNVPHTYNMIWEKNDFANCLIAKKAPVSYYEDVLVFSKTHDTDGVHPLRTYSELLRSYIAVPTKEINTVLGNVMSSHYFTKGAQFSIPTYKDYAKLIDAFNINEMDGFIDYDELKRIDNKFKRDLPSTFNLWEGGKYKSNILRYKKDYNGFHPTQKPVLLLEDLIKTFSNEGDTVVDLTAGSGSTAVASINTGRNFIAIEQDAKYAEIAKQRIADALQTEVDGGGE